MPVEEFFFQSSCSQKAGNFTKETPSKIFFKDSAKIINCLFFIILNRGTANILDKKQKAKNQ